MATWHPSSTPHVNHNASRYWAGVSELARSSSFERPRVSQRMGPPTPPSWQPGVQGSVIVDNSPAASQWRPDEAGTG